MNTYIAMLRGINVGGKKVISMAALTTLFKKIGFTNVRTYIQSGNLIFESKEKDEEQLSSLIKKAIHRSFGHEVETIIRTPKELHRVVKENPFLKLKVTEDKLHVTFLNRKLQRGEIEEVDVNSGKDQFQPSGREVYLYCPNGYGRTKLTNTFFEKKLNLIATTRNWKSVNKLIEMSASGEGSR